MKSIKNKNLLVALFFGFSLVFLTAFTAQTAFAGDENEPKPTIPAGCPGSTLEGPPAPGVCEAIPIGCPGSTQQGPPAPGFDINSCPYAASAPENDGDETKNRQENTQIPDPATTNEARDKIRDCDGRNGNTQQCLEINPLVGYTLLAINILSAGVGIIVVIMITIGGIQYASAGGDPSKVKAAKMRITNAIIALIAYFFLFAFMQWLVPGGFF